MDPSQPPSIPDLLTANLPRDLVLAVEEALEAGARRAFPAAEDMDDGHRSAVLGQMRHFCMNESFAGALELAGASPSQIRGNNVVVGRAGIVRLARFNISGPWYNARRSRIRRDLAEVNRAIEALVHPDLFAPVEPVNMVTAFFVSVFSGSLKHSPERPVSIEIAVPDRDMKTWLFRERVSEFVCRYNVSVSQEDQAFAVLKTGAANKKKDQEE